MSDEALPKGEDRWIAIGRLAEIPRRGARCVVTPAGRLAVFRTQDDQVFAMDDRCPHKGGPLSQGIVHDASVSCPLHAQVISLETGLVRGPDEGSVRTYAVRLDAVTGAIELALPRLGPSSATRPALAQAAE